MGMRTAGTNAKTLVSVIIIAQDEEPNIARAVGSCVGWAKDLFVVDGGSKDRTAEIAEESGAKVYSHTFAHWADQRNWALDHLPVRTEWVLFLDADEYVTTEFKKEVTQLLPSVPRQVQAVSLQRHFYFLGRPLRYAWTHPPIVRLVRKSKVRWKGIGAREYPEFEGEARCIGSRIPHDDLKPLGSWIRRHERNAEREAEALLGEGRYKRSSPAQHYGPRRFVLRRIWNRLPLVIRPFIYFFYRYVLRGGFLDGREGFLYVFFQALWYRMLIDAKYLEMRKRREADWR